MNDDWLLAEDPEEWGHDILLEAFKFLRKEHVKLMDKYDTIFLGGVGRCKFCGASLVEDWNNCSGCGAKLEQVGNKIQNPGWRGLTTELD